MNTTSTIEDPPTSLEDILATLPPDHGTKPFMARMKMPEHMTSCTNHRVFDQLAYRREDGIVFIKSGLPQKGEFKSLSNWIDLGWRLLSVRVGLAGLRIPPQTLRDAEREAHIASFLVDAIRRELGHTTQGKLAADILKEIAG